LGRATGLFRSGTGLKTPPSGIKLAGDWAGCGADGDKESLRQYGNVVALLAWLVVPAGALASHNEGGGQGSSRDFAVGTGENEIGRVSFAAHGGPSLLGGPVTGHFHAKGATPLGPFNIDGPVTCLNVIGREAGLLSSS
jgi:hypothetical protein